MSDEYTVDPELMIERLPRKWENLLEKLQRANGQSIVDFLPEIVDLTRSSSQKTGEKGLLSVLHTPLFRHNSPGFEVDGPTVVAPGYMAIDLFADAAGFPSGELREPAKAVFLAFAKVRAVSVEEAIGVFELIAAALKLERDLDEATAKRARRARRSLGVPKRRGHPGKNGQK